MTTALISAVCAIALGAGTMDAPKDTVNVYIIDNQRVEDFDGSQLVGRKVTDYTMARVAREAKRVHVITTSAATDGQGRLLLSDGTGTMHSASMTSKDVTILIDGQVHEIGDLDRLAPGDISSVRLYRAGSEVSMQVGKEGKDNDVIVVTTKDGLSGTATDKGSDSATFVISKTTVFGGEDGEAATDGTAVEKYGADDVAYVLDGKQVGVEKFQKVSSYSIKSVEMKKDAATRAKYGNPRVVMFITTK